MNLTLLTTTGSSRCVLPCGIEVIRKVGLIDRGRPETMHHTVIVAGQHGGEIGPVLALLARGVSALDLHLVEYGVMTIVRCANPYGFATGQRDDATGKDMNRGWITQELLDKPESAAAQIWRVITTGFSDLDLLVLDLHSAGMGDVLARKVVTVNDTGVPLALDLALNLALAEHGTQQAGWLEDEHDRPWDILCQWTYVDPSDRVLCHCHPHGTLAGLANEAGGVGLMVEFGEHTHKPPPSGCDEPIRINPEGSWRTMTISERAHGVGTLLRWAIVRRHAKIGVSHDGLEAPL